VPRFASHQKSKAFCFFLCNSQAAQKKNYLKKQKKERTSFCEQKEAKKL
jgi:hypothetical protein